MVAASARSVTSCAVGPSSTFPYTVGATSTPLVRAVGTGSRIERSSGRASLSNTMSSPRRGVIVNPPPPNIASIRSLPSPAALTTHRQRTRPARRRQLVQAAGRGDPGDLGAELEAGRPRPAASVAKASGVVHGQMMLSSGISSAPAAPGPRAGSRAYSSTRPAAAWVAWYPLRRAFASMPGSAASCSSVQATSSAPVRSTAIPASAA